jgi:hypothetical protein
MSRLTSTTGITITVRLRRFPLFIVFLHHAFRFGYRRLILPGQSLQPAFSRFRRGFAQIASGEAGNILTQCLRFSLKKTLIFVPCRRLVETLAWLSHSGPRPDGRLLGKWQWCAGNAHTSRFTSVGWQVSRPVFLYDICGRPRRNHAVYPTSPV